MKMKKEERLERKFDEYFRGSGVPDCDLSAAKNAVRQESIRRKRRRRGAIAALSACASLAVILALCITLPPAFRKGADLDAADRPSAPPSEEDPVAPDGAEQITYSLLTQTTSRSASYAELSASYGALFADFRPFDFAQNASCAYTVYAYGGREVLACAEVCYTNGLFGCSARVYTDLTNGEYSPAELREYSELAQCGGYRCETVYEGGEYVSRMYWEKDAVRYTQLTSPDRSAAGVFAKYFLQ